MPRSCSMSSASRLSLGTWDRRGARAHGLSIPAPSPTWAVSPATAALKRRAMAVWLNTADADFEDGFKALLAAKRETSADVNDTVAAIIARVRAERDSALIDLTQTYDGLDLAKA